jgi:CheY-like chemotaxis protein
MKPGARILVIDDNDDFRALLKETLEAQGFSVLEAGDGEEALVMMRTTHVNLAIVDLDMPKMNGMDFSRNAKKSNPGLPVIMITAYAQFYSAPDILSSGIDAFLHKPLDLERLFRAIEIL